MSVTPTGPIHIEHAGPLSAQQGVHGPVDALYPEDTMDECGYDEGCCACLLVVWRAICDFICCLFCGCCAEEPTAQKLALRAKDFFDELRRKGLGRLDLSKIPADTLQELVPALLKEYEGMAIGEYHEDSSPKYFMWLFMGEFVKYGVTTLYIEGYREGNVQPLFNAYFNSPLDAPMSEGLRAEIEAHNQSEEGCYTEMMVFERAKQAGIKRVIIIDHPSASGKNFPETTRPGKRIARHMVMNYYAKCKIEETRDGGKFIICAGSGHTSYWAIPPLGQIFGIPAIDFEDVEQEDPVVATADRQPPMKIQRALENKVVEKGKVMEVTYSDFHIQMHTPTTPK